MLKTQRFLFCNSKQSAPLPGGVAIILQNELGTQAVHVASRSQLAPSSFIGVVPAWLGKPRISTSYLGVLLIAAGFGYLADSVTPLLLPGYANVVDRFASIPLMLGEPALILWLLIIGAKDQPLRAAA